MKKKSVRNALVLSYAGCGTCKKAIKWFADNGVAIELRAIVEEPPTPRELKKWVAASGLPVRKWLNTSGMSYRAIGKEAVDAASDEEVMRWLTEDGKLVKRPVVVSEGSDGASGAVLVGFNEEAYRKRFM